MSVTLGIMALVILALESTLEFTMRLVVFFGQFCTVYRNQKSLEFSAILYQFLQNLAANSAIKSLKAT